MCTHFTFCCVSEADKVDISAATDFVVPFSELLIAIEVGEESFSFIGFNFLAAAMGRATSLEDVEFVGLTTLDGDVDLTRFGITAVAVMDADSEGSTLDAVLFRRGERSCLYG